MLLCTAQAEHPLFRPFSLIKLRASLPTLLPLDSRRPGSVPDALCLEVGSRRLLDTELVRWVYQYLQLDPPSAGAAAAAHP